MRVRKFSPIYLEDDLAYGATLCARAFSTKDMKLVLVIVFVFSVLDGEFLDGLMIVNFLSPTHPVS